MNYIKSVATEETKQQNYTARECREKKRDEAMLRNAHTKPENRKQARLLAAFKEKNDGK